MHSSIMDGLKVKILNDRINDLSGIDFVLMVVTIILVITILSFKSGLITIPNII